MITRKNLEALVWRHTHRNARSTGLVGSSRTILHMSPETHGTESWPLSAFTDDELLAKLPRSVREQLPEGAAPTVGIPYAMMDPDTNERICPVCQARVKEPGTKAHNYARHYADHHAEARPLSESIKVTP